MVTHLKHGKIQEHWRRTKTIKILSKEYGYKFTLVTYGDESDLNINNVNSEFDILPIYTFTKKVKANLLTTQNHL